MNKDATILVTGASGMVGQSLMAQLKSEGFDHLLGPASKDLDLRNQQQTHQYFNEYKPEYVFHLAGHIGGIKASLTRPVEFMYENLIMGMHTIHAAAEYGAKKLLFVGSSCIYPKGCPQPMKEEYLLDGKLEPTNEGYSIAKIAGMKLCEYYNKQSKRNFLSLMPCNLFGVNDHFETENSHVISALIYKMHVAKAQELDSVEIWGSGKTRREFLYVADFSDALIYFMKNYNANELDGFVNVGPGKDQSINELANMIKETVGFSGELIFNAEMPDGMPAKCLDVSKAKFLGWESKTDLQTGLKKAYDWYLTTIS